MPQVTPNSSEDRIDSCTIIDHLNSCKFLHRAEYFVDCSNGGEFSKLANVPGESRNPANTEPRKTVQNLFKSEVLIEIASSQNNLPFQCPDWINIRWENNLHLSRLSLMKSLEQQLCGFHRLEWISEDSNSPTPMNFAGQPGISLRTDQLQRGITGLFIKKLLLCTPTNLCFEELETTS